MYVGGAEDGQRDQAPCFEASASNVEALVDEFDRADVVAAVPEHPAERVVEVVDVAAAEAAFVGVDPSQLERHFSHEAESAAACGLRELDAVRLERPQPGQKPAAATSATSR